MTQYRELTSALVPFEVAVVGIFPAVLKRVKALMVQVALAAEVVVAATSNKARHSQDCNRKLPQKRRLHHTGIHWDVKKNSVGDNA
jgi:hypothetical protein